MNDALVAVVGAYDLLALAVLLFFGGLGVPVPSTLLVLAAGALTRQGVLDGWQFLPLALVSTVCGAAVCYAIARSDRIMAKIPWLRHVENSTAWHQTEAYFDCWGALTLLLTRFLLTPLALPANLIAATDKYDLKRFVTWNLVGTGLWLLLYGGLGFVFADRWEALGALTGTVLTYAMAGAVVLVAIYEVTRHLVGYQPCHGCAWCLRHTHVGAGH